MSERLAFPKLAIRADGPAFKLEATSVSGKVRSVELNEPLVREVVGLYMQVFDSWELDKQCKHHELMDAVSLGGGQQKSRS